MRRILTTGTGLVGLMVTVAVVVLSLMFAASAMATTTIGTMSSWNGTSEFVAFGLTSSGPAGTFGQTITTPSTDTSLQSFSFAMELPTSLVFRGEVYAWDAVNSQATGPQLYESAPTSTTSSAFQTITFSTGGVVLQAGQQYVLFATLTKDTNPADESGAWGQVYPGTYAGGNVVFSHSLTFSSLLSSEWNNAYDTDYAFSATFGPAYSMSFVSPTSGSSYKAGKAVPIAIQLLSGTTPMPDADAAALASAGKVTVAATGDQSLASHPMKYNKRTHQFTYNWRLARTGTGSATITVTGTGYGGDGSKQVSITITPAR